MSASLPLKSTKKAATITFAVQTSSKGATASSSGGRKGGPARSIQPDEYAKAVRGYSALPTGAGANHIALGEYLTDNSTSIEFHPHPFQDNFVILYPLGPREDVPVSPHSLSPPPSRLTKQSSDSDADADSSDERRHETRKSTPFADPRQFFSDSKGLVGLPQSDIIFLRGFMTAAWLNSVGARYFVDPEYFCRHLEFRPADDNSNNFSIPALPSSSWYLIELPVVTLGTRMAPKGPMQLEWIEELRKKGEEALATHHHRIAKLSSSGLAVGESMVRDFYVFDETHFAMEQRISICMQPAEHGKTFTLLVWLDSGADPPCNAKSDLPWSVQPPESYYLPVVLHKHMIALKCHLFPSTKSSDSDPSARSMAHLHDDYGRSLRPDIMARDAFYSLTEVFNFAASSQMEFLNLIDTKLDKYTSLPSDQDFQSLPHLKYTKRILYRHIQKTQRVIDSIKNAQHGKWPKDRTESGSRRATVAAQSIEQDFVHLLGRAVTLHQRTNEAIAVLMSSMSISESQKAMEQAQRVGKLTFFALIFAPLSFTTSLFGMNVTEFAESQLGVKVWVAVSLGVTGFTFALFYYDVMAFARRIWRVVCEWWTCGELVRE